MTPTCAESVATLAGTQAIQNFAANRAALERSQPDLRIDALPENVEWLFARDRALTFIDSGGAWLTGCSLPRRAAAEMMRKLDIGGSVACFLAPTHAAQLRVALDTLRREQSIIAIVPQAVTLAEMLACDCFVAEIEQNRIWFVAAEQWAANLKQLFESRPGLCTPAQFIRLPVADESTVDALIAPAQTAFAEVNSQRGATIRTLREGYARRSSRICVTAAMQFRLWDDAGATLASLLRDADPILLDLDDPANASTVACAQAASDCAAILTANTARSDMPGLLSESLSWITWASGDHIPAGRGSAAHDRIITAHPKLAQQAGWSAGQIVEAAWPAAPVRSGSPANAALAIIVDTNPLDPPDDLTDYSSHRVLWELIASDLAHDPFVLGDDIDAFLSHRVRKLEIATDSLPRGRFVRELILPAYQQGLARVLIRGKLPVKLFGKGWDRLPEFAPLACGAVSSREQLREIAKDAAALVHVWPLSGPHAIDSLGAPVLRRSGSHGTSFLPDARRLLAGERGAPAFSAPELSRALIERCIGQAAVLPSAR